MKKRLLAIIATCVLVAAVTRAQAPETPPREETRGERMAREVEMAEQAKIQEAAAKAAEEKYKKEQEEQLRESVAALNELLKKYEIEARENDIKREGQMKVDRANYQRKNIILGPILRIYDLFRDPQWADKMRRQEEARERARIEAERLREEKVANEALREADKRKAEDGKKKATEDARQRDALRQALDAAKREEQLRKTMKEINRINEETKAMRKAREESRKNINKGLEKLGGEKKPKPIP